MQKNTERTEEMKREATVKDSKDSKIASLSRDYGNVAWGIRGKEWWPCVIVTRRDQCNPDKIRDLKGILIAWIDGFYDAQTWEYDDIPRESIRPFDDSNNAVFGYIAPTSFDSEKRKKYWRAVKRAAIVAERQMEDESKRIASCYVWEGLVPEEYRDDSFTTPMIDMGWEIEYRVGRSPWIEATVLEVNKTEGTVMTNRGHTLTTRDVVRLHHQSKKIMTSVEECWPFS